MISVITGLLFGLSYMGHSVDLSPIIEKSGLMKKHFSLLVKRPGQDKLEFELNSTKPRVPASLTKIVTATAVLSEFPAGHKFTTELRVDGANKNKVLKGNLYLVGDGDPGFVSESMWNLVNNFVRSGIEKIDGDIVVDDSKFDQVHFDPSRNKRRVDRAYDSPVGAMSFNWNAVNIYIRPGESSGDPVRVYIDPENDYFKVVNNAKTAEGTKNSISIELSNSVQESATHRETITITGKYGAQLKEKVYYKAVEKPAIWSAHNLTSFLRRRGIEITGTIRKGQPPLSSRKIAEWESKPISQHVHDMMKYSNNYVAETLIKNLSAHKGTRPASLESGVKHLRDYLKKLGIKGFTLENPSGLSRDNKFTAAQIMQLLESARANFKVFPEFLTSLPIAGVDGTLKSRMKILAEQSCLRAKTGMLSGVAGLAGYVGHGDTRINFVFIYNGPPKQLYKARDLLDELGMALAKQ